MTRTTPTELTLELRPKRGTWWRFLRGLGTAVVTLGWITDEVFDPVRYEVPVRRSAEVSPVLILDAGASDVASGFLELLQQRLEAMSDEEFLQTYG